MTVDTDIRLGGILIGKVRLDSTRIRGEGGWLDPRLLIPIEIEMYPRPVSQQLALIRLTGTLSLGEPPSPANQVGSDVSLDLIENMNYRTIPGAPTDNPVNLCFSLTQTQVKKLEDAREGSHSGNFTLYLSLKSIIAWLRDTGNDMLDDSSTTIGEERWPPMVGMFSDLWPFWNTSIGALRAQIEPATWVKNVLPALGYDRVRLVEIQLSQMSETGIIASQFDKARRDLDEGRYEDCVLECRGIKNAWEARLRATRNRNVATVIREGLGWAQDDPRYQLLDKVWEGLHIVASAPHHPEQTSRSFTVTAADARFCFLMTVLLSEYVERLCSDAHL